MRKISIKDRNAPPYVCEAPSEPAETMSTASVSESMRYVADPPPPALLKKTQVSSRMQQRERIQTHFVLPSTSPPLKRASGERPPTPGAPF